MLRASADTVARVTSGEIVFGSGDAYATGVAVDSRGCTPGCAFIALPGERTDGHDHIVDALTRGARVIVVTRHVEQLTVQVGVALARGASVVKVGDGARALADLAAWHRGRLLCPVIAITGSTGKTSTKDLLRAALSVRMRVTSTEGNRNNELGVPLTVLAAGTETEALIVEMGMRGKGQITELCRIARPDMGLVTNVGTSHMELLGSQEAIAEAKGELVAAVSPDGAVFLNGDDAHSHALAARAMAPVTRYGLSDECDVRAAGITVDDQSRPSFTLVSPQGDIGVALPVSGRHNVYNALAAAAIALRLAVPLTDIAQGLATATLSGMRMEVFTVASGIMVINDAYNANPTSMRAALETLAGMKVSGRRVAVLGDMGELGNLSELAHLELGEFAAGLGLDALVVAGRKARRIGEGARAAGMLSSDIRPCATPEEALEVLDDILEAGDVVLVKASRAMRLEAVVEGLVNPRVG